MLQQPAFELAFRMQKAMPEAEDITKETAATRKLYGLDDPITAPFVLVKRKSVLIRPLLLVS